MRMLIINIKELVNVENTARKRVPGRDMKDLTTIKNAWLLTKDDRIEAFGTMDNLPEGPFDETIDATGKMVMPSWCDSHTHLVFAASREEEFVDKINGLSYQEIAQKGGGILNSARKLQAATEDELFESASKRLKLIQATGTGAVEIKSGYGLTLDAEIKMLRVIKRLKEVSPLQIKANFLGAHAIPVEYKENRTAYIDLIIDEMLPIVAKENLAEFIDVFCETGYYTPEETDRILTAGAKIGLKPKVHVNQFTSIGGIEASIKHGAVSVDHLEVMEDSDIKALQAADTIPTLLPSCSFFLNIPYGPAKTLMSENLSVALATDFNPGSTPSGNMNFVVSLACIQMKMTPEQAINAATINGAAAMELSHEVGSICKGKRANFFITKEIPSYAYLPYSFGENIVETVILNGKRA